MGHGGHDTELVRCFRSARVLTIEDLRHRFSVSRATAFRWLGEHGYFSSYNRRGMYVTVEEAAHFDSRGLWCFKGACFSRHGTLKATVEHFVTAGASGMTHEELSDLLGVRVHNPLVELVNDGAISRERVGAVFVYTSAEEEIRTAQIGVRMESGATAAKPSSQQIIAVLLELIPDPKVSREEIAARCQRSGTRVPREMVDAIFAKYDLGKERGL